jgi:Dit-like phage tail protein
MSILFPNVPNLPGVPQLARLLTGNVTTVNTGIASINNVLAAAFQTPSIWGVFTAAGAASVNSGATFNPSAILNAIPGGSLVSQFFGNSTANNGAVIQPDSIREFDMRAEWNLPRYPIQRGAFASYNKVIEPAEYSFRMVKGGSLESRQTFMQQVETAAASTDLYTIITPERTYTNCNPMRYEVTRKEAPGAFFIIVDMYFQQIIEATATYGSVPDTSNALPSTALPSEPLGTVTPDIPSPLAADPFAGVGIP